MSDFYTVDRLGTLTSGVTLDLRLHRDVDPAFLQTHVDFMFPGGVSRHGDSYFVSQPAQPNPVNEIIELLAEYIRRAHYPETPSRFQTWFAADSVGAAQAFRSEFCEGRGPIWRVRARDSFRADMRLLVLQDSNLVKSWRIHQYWQGLSSNGSPFWEVLLVPPVQVVQLVESGA